MDAHATCGTSSQSVSSPTADLAASPWGPGGVTESQFWVPSLLRGPSPLTYPPIPWPGRALATTARFGAAHWGHCGMRDLRFDVLGTCRAVESQSTPFAAPRPFSAHISPNSLALKGTSHHCSLRSRALGPLRHGRAKISHHEVLQGPCRASGRAPDLPGLHESGEPHSVRPEGPTSTPAASRSRSGPYGQWEMRPAP